MNNLYRALTFFALLFNLISQSGHASTQPDKELTAILNKYQQIEKLTLPFKQTKTIADMDLKLVSQGELTLDQPNGIVWQLNKPNYIRATLTQTEIKLEEKIGDKIETKKLNLKKADENSPLNGVKGLLNWLSLDPANIYSQFETTKVAPNTWSFKPLIVKNSIVKELKVEFTSDGYLKKTTMIENSADFIDIEFEKILPKKKP